MHTTGTVRTCAEPAPIPVERPLPQGQPGPVAGALYPRARLAVEPAAPVMVAQDAGQHAYRWAPPLSLFPLNGARR